MQVVTSEMPSMLTSNRKKAGSKPALYSLLGPLPSGLHSAFRNPHQRRNQKSKIRKRMRMSSIKGAYTPTHKGTHTRTHINTSRL
jgi:hypothetical protein